MKRIALLLFLAFSLNSCMNDDDDYQKFHIDILPIEEAIIPDSFEWNQEYEITLKYKLPNGCYHFHSVYYRTEETNRTLAFYAVVDEDKPCTEAIVEEEYTFKLTATQKADYTFKIWKGVDEDEEDIFEEIVVPVTNIPD